MASPWVEDAKNAMFTGLDYLAMPGDYARGWLGNAVNRVKGGPMLKDRLTGRELLEGVGLIGANQEGLDVGDVAGFGADLFLDPINIALGGLGAMTGLGRGAIKGARTLAGLASNAGRAESLAAAKAALGAMPGAAMKVLPAAGVLGGTMASAYGGSALMGSNEEGSDLKDLLGMGMIAAPFLLPLGMAAARGGKKLTGWKRQVAEFNAAEDAKIMQRIAEAKTPEEATRLQGLLSTAGKEAPPAAAPAPVQMPQIVTRERFSNPEEFYRVIVGDDAFKDIIESGLVRTKNITKEGASLKDKLGSRPTAFPSFSKGSASLETYGGDANHYVVVTSDASLKPSTAGRHGKGTTHFPTDPQGKHLPSLAGEGVDVYRHDGNGMYRLVYSKGKPVTNSPSVIAPAAAPAPPAAAVPRTQYESDFLEQLGFWDANRRAEAFKAVRDAGIGDVRLPDAEPILRAMAPPGLGGVDDWAERVQKAMSVSEGTRKYISKEALNEARAAMQPLQQKFRTIDQIDRDIEYISRDLKSLYDDWEIAGITNDQSKISKIKRRLDELSKKGETLHKEWMETFDNERLERLQKPVKKSGSQTVFSFMDEFTYKKTPSEVIEEAAKFSDDYKGMRIGDKEEFAQKHPEITEIANRLGVKVIPYTGGGENAPIGFVYPGSEQYAFVQQGAPTSEIRKIGTMLHEIAHTSQFGGTNSPTPEAVTANLNFRDVQSLMGNNDSSSVLNAAKRYDPDRYYEDGVPRAEAEAQLIGEITDPISYYRDLPLFSRESLGEFGPMKHQVRVGENGLSPNEMLRIGLDRLTREPSSKYEDMLFEVIRKKAKDQGIKNPDTYADSVLYWLKGGGVHQ